MQLYVFEYPQNNCVCYASISHLMRCYASVYILICSCHYAIPQIVRDIPQWHWCSRGNKFQFDISLIFIIFNPQLLVFLFLNHHLTHFLVLIFLFLRFFSFVHLTIGYRKFIYIRFYYLITSSSLCIFAKDNYLISSLHLLSYFKNIWYFFDKHPFERYAGSSINY